MDSSVKRATDAGTDGQRKNISDHAGRPFYGAEPHPPRFGETSFFSQPYLRKIILRRQLT